MAISDIYIIPYSVQCTVYSVHYTVYTVHCIAYSVPYLQCVDYSCGMYIVYKSIILCTIALYSVQYTLYMIMFM